MVGAATGLHHLREQWDASRDIVPGEPAMNYFQS